MEQSILKTTKKLLGIGDDDASFDLDLITHVNAAFAHLFQLGVGPENGYEIEDDSAEWADFLADAALPDVIPVRNAVKTNILLQVRLLFDPPQIWHILNVMTNQLQESDARLSMMRESTEWKDPLPDPTEAEEINELIMLLDSQVID